MSLLRPAEPISGLILKSTFALLFATTTTIASEGTLYWTNGDSLPGKLMGASDNKLQWDTPLFTKSFSIDITKLQNATFGDGQKPVKNNEKLRFVTQGGQVVYGDLADIRDDELIIKSDRMGEVPIKRNAIRSFRQLENDTFIYIGPTGKDGWRTLNRVRSVDDWQANNFGHLSTGVVGAELFRQLQLPAVTQIDITLRWKRKPGFVITFADPDAIRLAKQTIKLETWDDELVLQTLATTGDFEQLKTLTKDQKQVRLRLLWNQESGELSVYTPFGELLGKMTAGKENAKLRSGFYIQNKGSDLTLEHISVASWSGAVPSKIVEGQSFVQLNNGDVINGTITNFDADQRKLTIDTEEGTKEVAVSEITSVDFGKRDAPADSPMQLVYSDGTLLRGDLKGIEDDRVIVSSPISNQLLRAKLKDLRELRFLTAVRAEAADDTLRFNNAKLHGTLSPADDTGTLGWKPVGSENAAPLPTTHTATIQRSVDAETETKQNLTDIIYLKSGEVIPCDIIGISEKEIDIETSFTDSNRKIAHERVKAISLHTESEFIASSFEARNWQVLDGEKFVEFEGNQAKFSGQTTISLSKQIRGGMDLAFDAKWNTNQPSAMYFSFNGKDPKKRASQHDFLIYFLNQQVAARGLRRANGRGMVARQHMFKDGKARISIKHEENNIIVSAGENIVLTFPRDKAREGGGVLQIQVQQIGGRRVVNKSSLLTLSNLQMGRVGGTIATSRVDPEKKKLVLTNPRAKKQSPPTHVLVATNGDLLRGRLLGLNDAVIHFQSRLTKMVLPRDRISAIVWLNEDPSDLRPIADDKLKVNTTFTNGAQFTFVANRMTDKTIVGEHELFGDCSVPLESLTEIVIGHSVESARVTPFADWKLTPAEEPKFAGGSSSPGDPAGGEAFGTDSPLVGKASPKFTAKLLAGGQLGPGDLQNKVVVLDFWATWCGPCIKAMPDLIDVAEAYKENNRVEVIAINQQESEEVIKKFLADRKWEIDVATDPKGKIGRQFAVEGIPQTVVIGPNGKVERLHVGFHSNLKEELTKVIEDFLNSADEDGDAEDQAVLQPKAQPPIGREPDETKLVGLRITSPLR